MVQYLEIEGEEYPFFFSMRVLYDFTAKQNQEFDEMSMPEFDAFLDLFEKASKKGAEKDESDKALSADELEEFIDEDAALFIRLQRLYQESQAHKAINGQMEELEKKGN